MSCRGSVPFEEAESRRWKIVASIGAVSSALIWMARGSTTFLGVVVAITMYLMSGDRYQWVYIWRKTICRDLLGFRLLLITFFRVRKWERNASTLASIWRDTVKKYGDKKAIVMSERTLTFNEVDQLSNRVACYFKRQGFKSGEVIALFMDSQPEYVCMWVGLAKLGVVTSLINNNLRGTQLMHCLNVVSCKAVIFGDEMRDVIKEIQDDLADIPLFQYNAPVREDAAILSKSVPLTTELKDMPADPIEDGLIKKPKDILMYIYTSGTTGLPKAAIITNIRYLLIASGLHTSGRLSSSDVVYDPLPLHHTAGGVLGIGQALVHGCTVVIRPKFSASNFWKDCEKHGCTVAQYIGEMCRYLLAQPPGPFDRKHKVCAMLGNGLRPQIWEQFVQRFGIERVCEFYGATEGNSNLINLDSKVGAIGFLSRFISSVYPLVLVKCDEVTGEILRNEKGNCIPCGPFETGLLLGKIDPKKAILTFAGYADKSASEKKIVRNVRKEGDCYFNSGDIFIMDHFGYFYFKDRTGDTFRWRGENVSTAEVEGVISRLIGLKDAIVYGVVIPNVEGKAGMTAIADPDNKLDINMLAMGLRSSLPAYARPLFLRILPETPLTSTFKLKKKELMEQGFHMHNHQDAMYFLDRGEYVPLTPKLYDDIIQGVIRL